MIALKEAERPWFIRSLEKVDKTYDEAWKAPTSYLASANYHTTLACQEVHSTREAFSYAAALLAADRPGDLERAEEILRHAAALQEKDPAKATYGIWSWYMEEPLEKMSPPDWNWADFCGKEILKVLAYHGDRIDPGLKGELEDALRAACLSIFRRNMHAAYTNISIMGSYVTLHAGELLDWPWMFSYGRSRFEKFVRFTRANGGAFAEYNSATYTTVAIADLTRIRMTVRDPGVREMAEEMLDDAWRTVSGHFHAPTRQWCGPNARSYTWLTAPSTLSFLEESLDHEIALTDFGGEKDAEGKALPPFSYGLDWAYLDLSCPEKYRDAFRRTGRGDVNEAFHSEIDLRSPAYSVALLHKEEEFALGSWETSSAWNQRRSLLGFWGGRETRFLNLAMLHNLYDFSAGMFVVAQEGGHALILSSILYDAGDTHPNLDMIRNGKIGAYDLRLRIEAGGALAGDWKLEGDRASLSDGGLTVSVRLIGGSFEGRKIALATRSSGEEKAILDAKPDLHRRFTGEETRKYLDAVFYEGEEREIDLKGMTDGACALYLNMDGVEPEEASLRFENGYALAEVKAAGSVLRAASPASPGKASEWKGDAWKNGVPYKTLVGAAGKE